VIQSALYAFDIAVLFKQGNGICLSERVATDVLGQSERLGRPFQVGPDSLTATVFSRFTAGEGPVMSGLGLYLSQQRPSQTDSPALSRFGFGHAENRVYLLCAQRKHITHP
jgi:hypothetical protein